MARDGLDRNDVVALVIFLVASFVVAAVGSLVTTASLEPWYADLDKPAWAPPGSVIGAIWTVLYTLMALAAWLVWRQVGWSASPALVLYGVQLGLNALWSVLFFGLQNPAAGLGGIVALWIAILLTLVTFWRASPLAGALFVPYLTWVTIAGALNVLIWQMNP